MAVGAVTSAITQKITTEEVDLAKVGIAAAAGAVSGALTASPLGLAGQVIGSAIIGAEQEFFEQRHEIRSGDYERESFDVTQIVISGVISGGFALIGGDVGFTNRASAYMSAREGAERMIARELRRANVKYATKQIARIESNFYETTIKEATKAIGSFILGQATEVAASTGVSAILNPPTSTSTQPSSTSVMKAILSSAGGGGGRLIHMAY